ncbi:hypothetical protein WA00_08790 [Streptococcus agalactiae]|nr:hypothetical protein WA00_08790 [Streptococcus agalactiae]
MKKIGLLSNVFISLFIVILASGSVSSGVSANENKEISYNVLVSENKSIEDVEDVLQSQGIKVTDKIPEINFLTISTEKRSLSIILCKHSSKADIVNQIGFQVCPYIGQNLCGFVVLA